MYSPLVPALPLPGHHTVFPEAILEGESCVVSWGYCMEMNRAHIETEGALCRDSTGEKCNTLKQFISFSTVELGGSYAQCVSCPAKDLRPRQN